jgi:hypothetical protein
MTKDITKGWFAGDRGAVDAGFAEVGASFDRFCLAAGIEALGTMMEADVTAACGQRHSRDAVRRAHGWGRTRGRIGFHGGKIEVERSRVRGGRPRGYDPELGNGGAEGLTRLLVDEPDVDQSVDAPVRPRCPAARG